MDAYRDLGALVGKVVSAAVNVNQYHAKVSDTMAYSREQRLITVPDSQPRSFGKIKIIIPNGRG